MGGHPHPGYSTSPTEQLVARLDGVRPSGARVTAKCPAHPDDRNSLSVGTGDDGRALVKCHANAGCTPERIVGAVGLTMTDLFPARDSAIKSNGHGRRVVATYVFHDAAGQPVGRVVRTEPKGFIQERPDGRGGWLPGLAGGRLPLYNLPAIIAADPSQTIYNPEGEKDADRLAELGLIATTNAGGAGKFRPDHAESLRGRRVAILPDNDEPGRAHAEAVAALLHGIAAEVKIVTFPDQPPKGDVSDWIAAGGTADALGRIVAVAPAWVPSGPESTGHTTPAPNGSKPYRLTRCDTIAPAHVEWLWEKRIPRGALSLLDGDPGLGKSTLTATIAAAVTTGMPLPGGLATTPAGVVILSYEDDAAAVIVPRLKAAGADLGRVYILDAIPEPDGDRPPTIPHDLDVVGYAIHDVGALLVIIDPVMAALAADVDGHKDQHVRRALVPVAQTAADTGAAFLAVRHLSKATAVSALYRGGGSIGIVGAARAALLMAKDPDDDGRRVLAMTKNNLAAMPTALALMIEDDGAGVGRVAWLGESTISADEALAAASASPDGPEERGRLDEATEWLAGELAGGAVESVTMDKRAKACGIAVGTLRRAKLRLGVKSHRDQFGHGGVWVWHLPPGDPLRRSTDALDAQHAQPENDEHVEHLSADMSTLRDDDTLETVVF